MSDTVGDKTGRFSYKVSVHKNPTSAGLPVPRFADRWEKGSIQFAPLENYLALGTQLDCKTTDWEDILRTMREGNISDTRTNKVVKAEVKYGLAKKTEAPLDSALPESKGIINAD